VYSEEQPWRVSLFDADFTNARDLGAVSSLSVTPRWNSTPAATITVPGTHPRLAELLADGVRVVIEFDTSWDTPGAPAWLQVFSGPLRGFSATGPAGASSFTFTAAGDWRLLRRVLGWQVPDAPLSGQSASEYDSRTGAAETVLKGFVTANAVDRLGLPVTVSTDQERGESITVAARMHPLADVLFPAVELAGLGALVSQGPDGLVVDVREPVVHEYELSESSGAIRSWKLARSAHDATRVVVGGPGEGTARTFRSVVDAALESATGDVLEVFKSATDASTNSLLDDRGALTLAETAPTSGLSVELADTPDLRYGTSFLVGDVVTLRVGDVAVTDTLREVRMTWSPSTGPQVVPVVGLWDASPVDALARAVSRLALSVRDSVRR